MAHDTSREAALMQVEVWRKLGPGRTAELALDLSDAIRSQTLMRIRQQRPGLEERAYRRLLIEELYGVHV